MNIEDMFIFEVNKLKMILIKLYYESTFMNLNQKKINNPSNLRIFESINIFLKKYFYFYYDI